MNTSTTAKDQDQELTPAELWAKIKESEEYIEKLSAEIRIISKRIDKTLAEMDRPKDKHRVVF